MTFDFTHASYGLLIEHFCNQLKDVCKRHCVLPGEMLLASQNRGGRVSNARTKFMAQLRDTIGYRIVDKRKRVCTRLPEDDWPEKFQPISYPDIGRLFGCNHSTVILAMGRLRARALAEKHRELEGTIKAAFS